MSWIQYPESIFENLHLLNGNELKVLTLIVYRNSKGNFSFSYSFIKRKTNLCINTIKTSIDSLLEKKFIRKIGNENDGTSLYEVSISKIVCEEEIKEIKKRYVYVMLNKRNNLFKIGITQNTEIREKTLQSEEPEIEILFSFEGSSKDEKYLHYEFESKRKRGEWFELEDDDLTFIFNYLKNLNY